MSKLFLTLAVAITLAPEGWVLNPPRGLDLYMPVPASNPLTREKVERGRRLFFDKRLSLDGSLACAGCHDPQLAFSDGRGVARGIGSATGARNSPALINRGYGAAFFWDGRAPSLERQALEPIFNPKELGMNETELERRTGMKAADVAAALASFVRTIRSGDSPYDRYASGKTGDLSGIEKVGLGVFRGKGGCAACHIGPNFTDERFHNTGVAWQDGRITDDGRAAVTGIDKDRGAFKTPTLREIARTAPYMHDGSLATLNDVVDFYAEGGRRNPNLDSAIQPRSFTPEEKRALVAFLRTLSGRITDGAR